MKTTLTCGSCVDLPSKFDRFREVRGWDTEFRPDVDHRPDSRNSMVIQRKPFRWRSRRLPDDRFAAIRACWDLSGPSLNP
jgi:hypothetical protein